MYFYITVLTFWLTCGCCEDYRKVWESSPFLDRGHIVLLAEIKPIFNRLSKQFSCCRGGSANQHVKEANKILPIGESTAEKDANKDL